MAKKKKREFGQEPQGQKIELPDALKELLAQAPAEELEEEAAQEPLPLRARKQKLQFRTDRKMRRGKEVSLIEGFDLDEEPLEELAKKLRQACGVGGSVKDGLVILQGKQIEKAKELLKSWGWL